MINDHESTFIHSKGVSWMEILQTPLSNKMNLYWALFSQMVIWRLVDLRKWRGSTRNICQVVRWYLQTTWKVRKWCCGTSVSGNPYLSTVFLILPPIAHHGWVWKMAGCISNRIPYISYFCHFPLNHGAMGERQFDFSPRMMWTSDLRASKLRKITHGSMIWDTPRYQKSNHPPSPMISKQHQRQLKSKTTGLKS